MGVFGRLGNFVRIFGKLGEGGVATDETTDNECAPLGISRGVSACVWWPSWLHRDRCACVVVRTCVQANMMSTNSKLRTGTVVPPNNDKKPKVLSWGPLVRMLRQKLSHKL